MPQVSRKKLHKDVEKQIFTIFWQAISRCKDSSDTASFFSDILTQTEQIMLAKRYAIACLLLRGKSPIQINHILRVSFSTVSSVASWLKNAKPQTQRILREYLKGDQWSQFMDKVDELLDLLPPPRRTWLGRLTVPRYGSDWSQTGKDKVKRARDRATRDKLR